MTSDDPASATDSLAPDPAATPHHGAPAAPPSSGQAVGGFYPFLFSRLREGDKDPTLNKTVAGLIDSDDNFIVYLDEDDYVEWNMNDNNMFGPDTGQYLNRVGRLEAVDISRLPHARKSCGAIEHGARCRSADGAIFCHHTRCGGALRQCASGRELSGTRAKGVEFRRAAATWQDHQARQWADAGLVGGGRLADMVPQGNEGGQAAALAECIAARRGKRVAVVALARRLAGMLYALWRDGSVDDEARVGQRRPRVAVTV